MVTLTDQQNAFLTRLARSTDGKDLQEVLECYILALKDDCVFGSLDKTAAQAAITKLQELQNRIRTLASGTPPPSKNQFV